MSTQAFSWTALDTKAVDTARALAMDAVQQVGNGHPGTAMSLAPAAYLLFQRHLRHDPTDPQWIGRDRFVLSCGHSSLTLYIQLFLSGYELELDDLRQLRTWGSLTPGHPEYGHTPGVETTTGPLGQGVANAVGMAMAARRTRGLLDPETPAGESIFDHTIWCIASDGDLEEGVSAEASSLAGTQQLGNLILLWDDNHISIEDDTNIAFTEDVAARYQSYGWHVQRVDWLSDDGSYRENVAALSAALDAARAVTDRPSFIALRTVIGYPAPTLQGTGKSHGSALGADEVAATKAVMGLDPEKSFAVDPDVLAHARGVIARGRDAKGAWIRRFDRWQAQNPARAVLLGRLSTRTLPAGWDDALPSFPADATGMATRKASGTVLSALAPNFLNCGAAQPISPSRTTPHLPVSRRSCRRTARLRRSQETPTGGCCISGYASTPWGRSSTASPCTAERGRTAEPFSSSATTCVRRCAWQP
ncbi:transketolase [Rhodococcus wratislaviensis]|uniref:transketolase n=1 Tax=Rhodococcus wratislaviensis TaxID=44752 RepID=A0AB38FCJ2_RHOWR|nr:transketolase [Rhodococcus wratislaviensis]